MKEKRKEKDWRGEYLFSMHSSLGGVRQVSAQHNIQDQKSTADDDNMNNTRATCTR